MKKKLRSRRGFTLTEMIFTVLLLGIMSLSVAVGVSSSLNVYRESTLLSDAEVLCDTLTEVVMDELRFATNINGAKDPPTYENSTLGSGLWLATNPEGCLGITDGVNYNLFLQKGAYTGLWADIHYEYKDSVFTVKISVKQTKDSPTPIQTAEFKVRPK